MTQTTNAFKKRLVPIFRARKRHEFIVTFHYMRHRKSAASPLQRLLLRLLFALAGTYALAIFVLDVYSYLNFSRESRLMVRSVIPFSLTPGVPEESIKAACLPGAMEMIKSTGADVEIIVQELAAHLRLKQTTLMPVKRAQLIELSGAIFARFPGAKNVMRLGVRVSPNRFHSYDTSVNACNYFDFLPFCPQVKPWLKTYCYMTASKCQVLPPTGSGHFVSALNPVLHEHDSTVFYQAITAKEDEGETALHDVKQIFQKYYDEEWNVQQQERGWAIEYDRQEQFGLVAKYAILLDRDSTKSAEVYAKVPLQHGFPQVFAKLRRDECVFLIDSSS